MKSKSFSAVLSIATLTFTFTAAAAAIAGVRPLGAASPVTCAIPKPCALFTNTSTGAAVEGASASGTGLFGTSSSGVYYSPGVDGESSDSDGEDAGGAFGVNVLTTGIAPQYGVISYGNGIGVAGEENSAGTSTSNSGYGVYGQDSTGTASDAGDYNVGVAGASTVGTAVLGEANGSPVTFFGLNPIGVYAVADRAPGTPNGAAYAFAGESDSVGMYLEDPDNQSVADILDQEDYLLYIDAGNVANGGYVSVDPTGDEYLTGKLVTSKGTYVRANDARGTARMEYSDRSTVPQIEDVGEAQITNGRGYVTIDRDLADSIDHRASYVVFVTPEGDCKGLYVTDKSAAGFTVRELQGGRSSLSFGYRIVAKPSDETGARLAIAPPLKRFVDRFGHGRKARRPSLPPLTPQERLKRRMGTQAYAQAMLELRASRRTVP